SSKSSQHFLTRLNLYNFSRIFFKNIKDSLFHFIDLPATFSRDYKDQFNEIQLSSPRKLLILKLYSQIKTYLNPATLCSEPEAAAGAKAVGFLDERLALRARLRAFDSDCFVGFIQIHKAFLVPFV